MEDPARRSVEAAGPVEDPPPPTSTSVQDQSRSESLLDSTADSTSQKRPPPPPSPLTGCYLLIIVGEPHSDRHRGIILQKIAKGFSSWDVNECHVNLEKELQAITVQSPEGEEGRYGERLIQYATENLVTEILIHPQLNTLHQCMRNLLSSFTKHRHIVHAGYTFAGNGSWILQDGTLSISDLVEALHETEVLRVLKAYENSVSIDIHCAAEGDWNTERFQREPVSKLCNIRINPDDVMTAGDPTISSFIDYLAPFLIPANIQVLLQPTDVVGNIRFTHPTLYVFPGGQGDAALFGINGFNMLVDGGFARKACFWDFARHLDRLDAVLLTRLNNSTVNGISAVLQRKKMNHVYPQIGHFFCNLQDRKIALSPDGDKDKDSLIVNLAEEGQEIVANLRHLALKPHPCYRDGNQVDPVNLYHKVGHGKLDMYVISPARDSQAVKEFLSRWSSNDNQLFSNTGKKIGAKGFDFPLQNLVSICALLVWQPANPNDTITRILFPGSTPQHKIFEGLDKLRHLEFLKHPICSARSISPSASTITVTRSLSKTRQAQTDAKAKMASESKSKDSKPIEQKPKPQARPIRKADRSPPKDLKPKTDTNKLIEDKKEAEKIVEKPTKVEDVKKVEDGISNLINKDEQIEKIEKEIRKIGQEQTIQKIEADIKKIEQNGEETKKVIHKSKYDLKNVKSKVDSRAPSKSIDRKKLPEKKTENGSPPTTPKKSLVNGTATKAEKSKTATSKPTKSSPSATPAKSTKEANNRKVVEARVVSRTSSVSRTASRPPKKEETPPPAPASTAPTKTERKPISRRPKASSPAKKTPASPVKSTAAAKPVKPDQDAVKKVKRKLPVDLEKPATDSTVSTPSADADAAISKKDIQEKPSEPETLAQDAKTDVEDVVEEATQSKEVEKMTENIETDQQAVKDEIHKEIEKEPLTNKLSQESAKSGESDKNHPGEVPEEEEEYLIITKEESTEESGKGEESEKENENDNDNESLQEDIETKDETEGEGETKKILRDEEDSEKRRKIQDGTDEELIEETEKDDKIDETTQRIEEIEEKTAESKEQEKQEVDLPRESKSALKEEVQEIVESAEEAAKAIKDGEETEKKIEGEGSEESPQEKSSDRKDNQTKSDLQKLTDFDEGIDLKEPVSKEHKEGESLPDEKFSTTVETSATTAPTLPEDERIEEPVNEEENKVQLDEIKEVVEEKYIKEETKEDKLEEIKSRPEQPSTLPKAASPPVVPTQEATHHRPHPRDIVKTPDEVADLPVHEEVDAGMYSSGEFTKELHQKLEDETDAKKQDDKSKENEEKIPSKETTDYQKVNDFKETVKGEAVLLDDEDTEETRKLDNADKTLESVEEKLEEEIAQNDKEGATSVPEKEAKIKETIPTADALTSKYLDIIDKLEKTSETTDNRQDDKNVSPEKDSKTSAIIKEEEPTKESLEAPVEKDIDIPTNEKEISKSSTSPAETAPTTTIVPESIQSGKTTPQKELLKKRTPSPAVEIEKTSGVPSPALSDKESHSRQISSPLEKEIPEKTDRKESAEEIIRVSPEANSLVSSKRESMDATSAITAEKSPSGKSTPVTSDQDSKQPPLSPIEKVRLSSGKITPEEERKSDKSDSARSTPAPTDEKSSIKETIAPSGKATPEKLDASPSPGKTSPKDTKIISERISPCLDEKTSSGKGSPDLKESSGKTTPTVVEKPASGKTTPVLDEKDFSRKTSITKDETVVEQSKLISIDENVVTENIISGRVSAKCGGPSDRDHFAEPYARTPTPSEKIASGKTSPAQSDKVSDKSPSGKTTPAPSEKDISGKSTPDIVDKIASGKSTPFQSQKGTSGKTTPDVPDEIGSGKVTPDTPGKYTSGKTSPNIDEKIISGKTSSAPLDKDASEKTIPAPSDTISSGKMSPAQSDKDVPSEKTTPTPDKGASGKTTPALPEKLASGKASPTPLDKDVSVKTTPSPTEKDASGKTTPAPPDKDASERTTPAPSDKIASGKTTPAPSDKDTSGKTTPAPLDKDAFEKTTPTPTDTISSGKISPALSDKDESGKTTPTPDKCASGKTTPAPSEKQASGKASPAPSVKEVSGKITPAPSDKNFSGKTTPAPLDKDASGKTTPAPSDEIASGNTSPAPSDKGGSGKVTPAPSDKDASGKTTPSPSDKIASGKTTPAPSSKDGSGKVTPALSDKDGSGKVTPALSDKDGSGKVTPAPSDKDASGKTTPAPLDKDGSGKVTPVPSDKDASGKTTPASSDKIASGKTTPAPSSKDDSGKVTPATSDKDGSGKVTPAPSDKDVSGKTTPAPLDKDGSGKVTPAPSDKDASGKTTPASSDKIASGKTTPAPSSKDGSGKVTPAPSDKDNSGKVTPAPSNKDASGKSTPVTFDNDPSGKTTPDRLDKTPSGKTTPAPSDEGASGKITPVSDKGESGKITPSPIESLGKITPDVTEKTLNKGKISPLSSENVSITTKETSALEKVSPVCDKPTLGKSSPSPVDKIQSLVEAKPDSCVASPIKEEILKSGQSSQPPSGKGTPSSEPEKVKSPLEKVVSPSAITSTTPDQSKHTGSPTTSSGKISPAQSFDKKSVADSSGKNTPSDKLLSGKSTPLEKLTNGIGICNDSDELEKGILESERHEKESHVSDDISSDEDEELKALQHADDNDSEPEEEITRERLQSLAHSEITVATPDSVPESPTTKKLIESEVSSESPKLDADRTEKEVSQEQPKIDSVTPESPLAVQKDKKDDLNALVKSGASNENEVTSEQLENHAAVKRMLVTASSEDGGTETEICAQGSIRLSKSEGVSSENKEKDESSPETSDVDEDGTGEAFSSLILQARKEYNLQRSRKSSCNSPDRQSPDEEKDPSRKQSREEQPSPNQQLTEDSTDTLSTEQSSVIQKPDVNGCADQTSSSVSKALSKTKTTSRSETSRMDETDIITITTILTEEREEQEDGNFLVTTTKEVVTKGGRDAGTVVTVNSGIVGSNSISMESSSKTETEEKAEKMETKGATVINAEDEEPLSPLSVTSQLSPSPTPGFDFDDFRRSACQDFEGRATGEKEPSTSSTIAFTETRKIAEEKISGTETITKTAEEEVENKDVSRKSSTGSQDEKRTSSKEESEVRLSQGDQDNSQKEESRRTSVSSTISQEDLVSRKDSTRIEELRTSSIELSPLKTTYITSQTAETGESPLMTSSFYGALPTEDEMILSASYTTAKSDVTSEVRKGKGYESVTEIGPDGEKTERTYFYGTEPEISMSSSFYMKGIPEPIPEAPEITPEKTSFAENFSPKDSFLPEEHMDFARAVDEHRSARGEDLSKCCQYDLGKYSNGKSTPSSKQEVEKLPGAEKAKVEPSTSEIKQNDKDQQGPAEKEKKDAIEGWGKPLGLPLPPKNTKATIFPGQNISTTSSLSTPSDNSDSITNWGQPMSLPSPAPPIAQNGTADSIAERTASVAKETPKKERKQVQNKKNVTDNKSSGNNTPNRRSESPVKPTEKRAPSLGRNNKSSTTPIYLDLTYVPHHGNSYYSNVEFFKRIRARYYVFSGTEPSKEVYNALLEAKQTWDDKDLEVTIIPTYDTDVLGYWVAENEEVLAKHKIDLSPSASRCTINLQDHETSCSAYRLEF